MPRLVPSEVALCGRTDMDSRHANNTKGQIANHGKLFLPSACLNNWTFSCICVCCGPWVTLTDILTAVRFILGEYSLMGLLR